MLNGLDPLLIFLFYKKVDPAKKDIPDAGIFSKIPLVPVPIYLSEKLTGLYVSNESKNIDIETNTDSLLSGGDPQVNQKAINSIVKVSLHATKDSIGLSILSALADLILPKVASQEYSLTYFNGATTIFGGLIHSFSIDQESNSTLVTVNLEIVKTSKKTATVIVEKTAETSLNNAGAVPTQAPTGGGGSGGGSSSPVPSSPQQMPIRMGGLG